jgi:uncharacterized coiled-coil DUF342 family protein
MTEAEIREEIDKLSKPAEEMLKNADPLWSVLRPTPFDWMTYEERKRLHELKMMLPSFANRREEAKERLKKRMEERDKNE